LDYRRIHAPGFLYTHKGSNWNPFSVTCLKYRVGIFSTRTAIKNRDYLEKSWEFYTLFFKKVDIRYSYIALGNAGEYAALHVHGLKTPFYKDGPVARAVSAFDSGGSFSVFYLNFV